MTTTFDNDPRPEPLHEWRQRGFTVAEARRWIAGGFLAAQAERWRAAGVYRAEAAGEWRTAGATPYTVERWLRAGMTPRDAVRWHEAGVTGDEAAERHLAGERPRPRGWFARRLGRRHRTAGETLPPAQATALRALLHAGVPAAVARGFVDTGWDGGEATAWARRRIDPGDAKILRALGFTAAEATRVLPDGGDAATVMTAWWRAGIPVDEVAAWAAAGFTPAEAAGHRDRGATAEQARVLRALTEDDDHTRDDGR